MLLPKLKSAFSYEMDLSVHSLQNLRAESGPLPYTYLTYIIFPVLPIADHAMETGHDIEWDSGKILDKNNHCNQRSYLEA